MNQPVQQTAAEATPQAAVQPTQPSLREIGSALEAHLNLRPESDVHWVVVKDECSFDAPGRIWDQTLSDSLLQVSVAQGFSEGMLIYVHAQRDRYKPGELVTLWMVKLLCGKAQVFIAARDAWDFLNSKAFYDLTDARLKACAAAAARTSQTGSPAVPAESASQQACLPAG